MKKLLLLITSLIFTVSVAQAKDMRFVQVDGAMFNPSNEASVKRFEKMIKDINNQRDVDFVVFTGNNISKPQKSFLEGFISKAKSLNSPFYVVIGNKDVNKSKKFAKTDYVKILSKNVRTHKKITSTNYTFKRNGIVFVVVDGAKEVLPSSMGYYRADTLEWLKIQLETNKKSKVIILQHFPIVPPSKRESHYTYKPENYMEIISKYNNIKAVISGHFDINSEKNIQNILHITTADAPKYRVIDILDYDTETPMFWSTIR